MKLFKKILAVSLSMGMLFSVAACGGGNSALSSPSTKESPDSSSSNKNSSSSPIGSSSSKNPSSLASESPDASSSASEASSYTPTLEPVPFETVEGSKKEKVAGGYTLDMGDLPQLYFENHPEWTELYNQSWEIHKSNIQKIPAAVNPNSPYYVDEAFSGDIFVWDTIFMMLYDRYGMNQFPVLTSMENFYYCQTDSDGVDNGYIPREIVEKTGKDYWNGYTDPTSTNPPLFSFAEWQCYQIHGDLSRFEKVINGKTIYQRLCDHYSFIENNKKLKNGLYGNTNGLGTGLDNSPNQGDGQTYNSLSIQQAQNAYYLALIAEALGKTEDASFYFSEHERISKLINDTLWSEAESMYSNLSAQRKKTNISTPTSLWALIGRVATPERAKKMIFNQALNSSKLFRPNGFATLAYDYKDYVAEGGYWKGGIWAPTTYQYIKGLEVYGYKKEAFEEALRNVNTVLTVYQSGKEGGYVSRPTLWENYSAEYFRNGYMSLGYELSRPQFCGWTACMSIGLLIENVAGIGIYAPQNQITWDVNLTEHFSVSNLYYQYNGEVNRVSLSAAKRNLASDPLIFSVKAEQAFDLVVTASGVTKTYHIEKGVSTFCHTENESASDKEPSLGIKVLPYEENAGIFSSVSSALDYFYFTQTASETVQSGIPNIAGKLCGKLYNIDTIGRPFYSNPDTLGVTENPSLQQNGFEDAAELTRGFYVSGNEGFMLCSEADTDTRTLYLAVSVSKGCKGMLLATLSDASSEQVCISVPEGNYILELPYSASAPGYYILVRWTVDNAGLAKAENCISDPNCTVGISAALLVSGGEKAPVQPKAPVNISVKASETNFTVNASAPAGETYDTFLVQILSNKGLLDVIPTQTLPITVEAEPGKSYTVTVIGVKNGTQSAPGSRKSVSFPKAAGDIISGTTSKKSSINLNLTEKGVLDWIQFSTDDARYARKENGTGLYGYVRNHTAVPSGEKGRVVDAPIYYSCTDCDKTTVSPINKSGVQVRGMGNGFSFFVKPSGETQTLYLYSGTWVADGMIEVLVDGEVEYSYKMSGGGMNVFESILSFKLEESQTVEVRITLGNPNGNGSALLFAAALA